ncbi:MAG: DUF4384 domain-containing protein [Candidatus Tectimicrobiota bacterium]
MFRGILLTLSSLVVFCAVCVASPGVRSAAAQERVRAKVGVEVLSGEHRNAAKATEKVKMGDAIRVHVMPEAEAYVYVVHNDGKMTTLLNARDVKTKTDKGERVILPNQTSSYKVDGMSEKEVITVICSPQELPEVTTLLSATSVPSSQWMPLEKSLLDRSKIDLGQKTDTPFQMAGNVRSLERDPFLDHLQIYSGKSLMVKKYELQVQK